MTSLYFTQYRSKTGLATAGLHVYRSRNDRATKQAVKRRLGVVPMTGAGVPSALASQLSADELRDVQTKLREVTTAVAYELRARAELLDQGPLP